MLNFFFSFNGRVRRTNYFFGALVTGFVASIFSMHALHVGHVRWVGDYDAFEAVRWTPPFGFWLVGSVVGFACFWAKLALASKRWHDTGATGWLAVLQIIPFIEFLIFILLCLIPPTRGPNQYGPDPRGATAA
jgi:uncharacterized membrane protein YhaH (DUF805 family)